ncbi:neurogenin-1-like [Hydractinia symbiolongicarpus]|uniref:neurogenin-1-like n=1 Tax=Hydractinia symbiolongicarpus TaxID=13093 RepID=UPI00254B3EDD|nr:neurogenin-1-like [Hydractinia symbiolongicarpus]
MAELSNHSYHYKSSSLSVSREEECNTTKKKTRRKRRRLTGVSKQRRAANERERKRLQIINSAYTDLKSALPLFPNEENISKIEIIRLASKTIKYLSELLEVNPSRSPGGSESSEMSSEGSVSSNFSDLTDVESTLLDPAYNDLSTILFPPEDCNITELDLSDSSLSLGPPAEGFNGLDINFFLNEIGVTNTNITSGD